MAWADAWQVVDLHLPDGREPQLAGGRRFDEDATILADVQPGTVRDFTTTAFNVPIATRKLAEAAEASAVARLAPSRRSSSIRP